MKNRINILFKYSCFLALGFTVALNTSCSKKLGDSGGGGAAGVASVDGISIAEYDSESEGGVVLSGDATSSLEGVSITIEGKSLSGNTDILLQEGASLATGDSASLLGLSTENPITGSGTAVHITTSEKVEVSSSFRVLIPLPKAGALQEAEQPNLVVIFKGIRAESGYLVGILPRDSLRIEGEFVSFGTTLFGVYQAVTTTDIIAEAKKYATENPILSKTEYEAKALDNVLPTLTATSKENSKSDPIALDASTEGFFAFDALRDNPMAELNFTMVDENSDALGLTVEGCAEWMTCQVFDGVSANPSLTITGTPASSDGGDNVVTLTGTDFVGEAVTWALTITVEVPTVYPDVASLAFLKAPTTQNAVSCLEYTLATLDADGNVTSPADDTIVFLTGNGYYYDSAACDSLNPLSQVTFGYEVGTIKVYYRNPKAGLNNLSINALESYGWTSASFQLDFAVGPAELLSFGSSSIPVFAGECTLLTVTIVDTEENPSPVDANTSVTLSGEDGTFWADAGCSENPGSNNQVTIAAGDSATSFYYYNEIAPGKPVVANAPGFDVAGNVFVGVAPLKFTKLGFFTDPISLGGEAPCVKVEVEVRDEFDNRTPAFVYNGTVAEMMDIVVTLSITQTAGAPTALFYPTDQCLTPTTTLTVLTTKTIQEVYVKAMAGPMGSTGTVDVTATGDGNVPSASLGFSLEAIVP